MTNVLTKAVFTIRVLLIVAACYVQGLSAESPTCCPTTCCYGQGFLSADLLYWRACQGGQPFCAPGQETDIITNLDVSSEFRGKSKDLHTKWRPGFRVGAGFQFSNDWDVAVFYTDFRSKTERHYTSSLKYHWDLDFQVIDLVGGYTFCVHPCFTLRPFFGLRGAIIDQSFKASQFNPCCFTSSFKERNKQDLKGIGPLVGLGANFNLGCGFGIYADLAVSTLYGNYKLNFRRADKFQGGSNASYLSHHLHACTAVVDAAFGISWEESFCNQMRVIFRLGVEHHCYFNQNRLGTYGDLNLDGGTFSATLVF